MCRVSRLALGRAGGTGDRYPVGRSCTLPPTGTVTAPPRIDSQARLSSPFTLLGQAAIAGASDAIPNGNLVYVCGSSGISVFDVTNVTAPQFLRTVGTPANTCQIRGDRLVALRGGNTFVVALYTLSRSAESPAARQHAGDPVQLRRGPGHHRYPCLRHHADIRLLPVQSRHLPPHRGRSVVRPLRPERSAIGRRAAQYQRHEQ